MNKEVAEEIRLEDLGKQVLTNAPPLEQEIVAKELTKHLEFLDKHNSKPNFLLLFGKELGYHQVFQLGDCPNETIVKWILSFMQASYAQGSDEGLVPLTDVRMIENSSSEGDSDSLDIWFGVYYFQLLPFDWGVEVIEEES